MFQQNKNFLKSFKISNNNRSTLTSNSYVMFWQMRSDSMWSTIQTLATSSLISAWLFFCATNSCINVTKIWNTEQKQCHMMGMLLHSHPIETAPPNTHSAVNCTGFGCTIKRYFLITPEFYRIFLWKVLHTAIDITDHFCMTTKFSKHECNSQLSYPDHSRYHNVNFHCNLQVFLIC